jgi:hypothetical protein
MWLRSSGEFRKILSGVGRIGTPLIFKKERDDEGGRGLILNSSGLKSRRKAIGTSRPDEADRPAESARTLHQLKRRRDG